MEGSRVRKRLIKELVEGKHFATQLQTLLQKPNNHGVSGSSADELVLKIWTSFTEAITELNTLQIEELDQAHPSDPNSGDSSSEFTNKDKLRGTNRRGCYKRRKTSGSWMIESSRVEDGCAWRKYGQKNILNSKYPRCYFRCTHKYDQDCRATKQVQIIQENPIIYQSTYFGHHTCNSAKIPKHIISTSQSNNHQYPMVESPCFEVKPKIPCSDSTLKEEKSKVQISDDLSSTMDSSFWQDFMPSSPSDSYFGKFGDFHFEAIESFLDC